MCTACAAAGYLQGWCVMGVDSRLAPVLRTSQPMGASSGELQKSPRGSDVQLGLKATAEPFITGRPHLDGSLKRWAVLITTYSHAKLFQDGSRLWVPGRPRGTNQGASGIGLQCCCDGWLRSQTPEAGIPGLKSAQEPTCRAA